MSQIREKSSVIKVYVAAVNASELLSIASSIEDFNIMLFV